MNILSFFPKFFLGSILSIGLGCNSNLETIVQNEAPKREVSLNFENPLDSYESNTKLWHSINQLSGNNLRKLDNTLSGRIGLTLFNCYLAKMFRYYQHEIAHEFELKKYGFSNNFPSNLDFSNWDRLYPNYIQKPTFLERSQLSEEEKFRSYVNGLNQDEFSAQNNWRQGLLNQNANYSDSIFFLFTKLQDLGYLISIGLEDKRALDIRQTHNDIDEYVKKLQEYGIDLSKRDYLKQVLISDLLSFTTWESFFRVGKYLKEGTRDFKPVNFPLINTFLTQKGTYFDINFLINNIEYNIGAGADSRFGIKYHNLISPFIYGNSDGYSAGVNFTLPIKKSLNLTGKIEFNDNDVVENIIKGKDKGFNFSSGIKYKF